MCMGIRGKVQVYGDRGQVGGDGALKRNAQRGMG